jgi:mRNA interferase MazF
MELKQYKIVLVNLDPTIGHEIKKTRPCLIISPDEMNRHLQTVIVAPITSQSKEYPSRLHFDKNSVTGWIVLDQVRTIDRRRIIRELDNLSKADVKEVKRVILEMLVE